MLSIIPLDRTSVGCIDTLNSYFLIKIKMELGSENDIAKELEIFEFDSDDSIGECGLFLSSHKLSNKFYLADKTLSHYMMSVENGKRRRSRTLRKRSTKRPKEPAVVDFIKNPSFTEEVNCGIFKELEAKAHQAINSKKVFTVVGGFEVIRQSMQARGWIERIIDMGPKDSTIDEKMISETTGSFDTRRIVLSHLVKQSPVYFIWQPKHFDGISMNIHNPLRNRITRLRTSDFTLKEGLHNLAENIHWHLIENVSTLNYPRSFLLMDLYQRNFFIQEFRRTMITSFLFYLNDYKNFDNLFAEDAVIPIDLIYNCIQRIEYHIKIKQNLCVDLEVLSNREHSLNDLTKQIDLVVNQKRKIRYPGKFQLQKLEVISTF